MKHYKAEYEDDNFELIDASNDNEALTEAWKYEFEHGTLFNLFEVNEDYDEIKTVL